MSDSRRRVERCKLNSAALTKLHEAGEFESEHGQKFFRKYKLDASWPMPARDFGVHAEVARPILDRLQEIGIDVRRTMQGFLWITHQLGHFADSIILIDLDGANLNHPLELLDTLCHEAMHATGSVLKRWPENRQPENRDSRASTFEEAVAITGAAMLTSLLAVGSKYDPATVKRKVDLSVGSNRVVFSEVEEQAARAVSLLRKPPSTLSVIRRRIREIIGNPILFV